MTVIEALRVLTKHVEEGRGSLELVCEDVRNGDTGSCGISSIPSMVRGNEERGHVLEMDIGTRYVPVWMDH